MKTKKWSLKVGRFLGALLFCTLYAGKSFAEQAGIDSGDTSWLLTSTALVLLMTPGLAFFYGGMVNRKNAVTTMFQSFIAMGAAGILWVIVGYSLAFSTGNAFIGDMNYAFLKGVGMEANGTIPHLLFMAFQAMFAIITVALISGALAERMSFKGWILFSALWGLVVYAPIAHWVWGGGWIAAMGGLDFAGGLVVHMSAGFSALTAALFLGKRKDKEIKPYNVAWILLGTGLLWFGWFGFNAGSALAADGLAALAFVNTFIASAMALLAWSLVDCMVSGKPSAIGAGVGVVVGLVAITPAAGFVTPMVALLIGALAGVIPNLVARLIKATGIDDTLDVFACHGIGGLIGVVMTGIFATETGLLAGGPGLQANLAGAAGVIAISVVGTLVLLALVKAITGIRVEESIESSGLDIALHGESVDNT